MVATVNHYLDLLQHGGLGLRTLWLEAAAAFASARARGHSRRPTTCSSGVSREWLRAHAIESAKHSGDRWV